MTGMLGTLAWGAAWCPVDPPSLPSQLQRCHPQGWGWVLWSWSIGRCREPQGLC